MATMNSKAKKKKDQFPFCTSAALNLVQFGDAEMQRTTVWHSAGGLAVSLLVAAEEANQAKTKDLPKLLTLTAAK